MSARAVIQRTQPTAPRIKRVHSNSNRKNTFSDYEFSIFTPVLNFFHAHRVSAKGQEGGLNTREALELASYKLQDRVEQFSKFMPSTICYDA